MNNDRTIESAHRRKRLVLAYTTSGGSKIFSLAVQLIALPMAGASLTGDRFGALFVLAAIGSFLCIPGQGFSPAMSFVLSESRGRGTPERTGRAIWAMCALSTFSGVVVLGLTLLLSATIDPVVLIGPESRPFANELRWGLVALAVHVAAFYFFWFSEGARAAYLENHVTNLYVTGASAVVLLGTAAAATFRPTIGTFYLAMYAPPALFQGVSFATMALRRRREWGPFALDRGIAREICSRALSYSRAQIGNNLYLHGTVYVAAHTIGLQAGAIAGATIRLIVLVTSFLLSLLAPLLPSLSLGLASEDHTWVHRSARRMMVMTIGIPFLFGIVLMFGGRWIFDLWLNLDFPKFSLASFFFAMMGGVYMSAYLSYMVLTALGDPAWGSRRTLTAGLVGFVMGLAAALAFGLTPFIAVQSFSMLVLATIPILIRLMRRIQALERRKDVSVQPAS